MLGPHFAGEHWPPKRGTCFSPDQSSTHPPPSPTVTHWPSPAAPTAGLTAAPPPAELADVGVGEAMLAVSIPERPGSFLEFVETALGRGEKQSIQVTEFKYRWGWEPAGPAGCFSLSSLVFCWACGGTGALGGYEWVWVVGGWRRGGAYSAGWAEPDGRGLLHASRAKAAL